MSSPDAQPCCVCGKETTQKCGSCAAAGFDLFFCSREHQKLIWYAHKRVCGANAIPFRHPLLTRDEADEAIRRMNEPCFLVSAPDEPDLRISLKKRMMSDMDDEHCIICIDGVTSGSAGGLNEDVAYMVLMDTREANWIRDTRHCSPFDSLAAFEVEPAYGHDWIDLFTFSTARWLSDLRHKALTFYAVKHLMHQEADETGPFVWGPLAKYVGFTRTALEKDLDTVVRKEGGDEVADGLLQHFKKMHTFTTLDPGSLLP
ncbi:hypothetical protein JCM10213_007956 [Rhodosporidiobolus nylandii]